MKITTSVNGGRYSEMYASLEALFEQPFNPETVDDAPGLHGKLEFVLHFRHTVRMKLPVRIELHQQRQAIRVQWHVQTVGVAILSLVSAALVATVFFITGGLGVGATASAFVFLIIYLPMCWQIRRTVVRHMHKLSR